MLPDAEALADIVASAIKSATAPLLSRLVALEATVQRAQVKAIDRDAVAEMVALEVAKLPAGPAGKDADPELIAVLVKDAVAAMPQPRDGQDGHSVTLADVEPLIKAAVDALPKPKDGEPGRSVELSDVQELITKAVEAIPRPQDGRSVTIDDLEPLVQSVVTKAVEALPRPKDGISVVGALVDRDGHLVQTFSDGSTKDVGVVVGRDYDPSEMARMIAEEVARIPRPKDGRDGTLDNLKVMFDGDRTATLCFKDGTPVEGGEIVFGHPMDRGVWRPETTYVKGDGVSFGGSFFIAQKDDPGKPEVGDGWRLAVKRGRDGKAGKDGRLN